MTNANGLPPQAYTKETLAEAFEWLKSQPDYIAQLAKDPSSLVSLYRSHQMRSREGFASPGQEEAAPGMATTEAPAPSGERFKSELKDLAQGLEAFAPPPQKQKVSQVPQPQSQPQTQRSVPASKTGQQQTFPTGLQGLLEHPYEFAPSPSEPRTPNLESRAQTQTLPPHVTRHRLDEHHSVSASNGAQGERISGLAALLDASSQSRVAQVRQKMNLSSDNEALRMLISLGFDRLKNILPVD